MNQLKSILRLLLVVVLLIIVPAWLFETVERWHVLFLAAAYFLFFWGTAQREVRHGQLVERENDQQTKRRSGRLAGIVAIVGLIAFHWLALYDFSFGADEIVLPIAVMAIVMVVASLVLSQTAIRTLGRFFDRLTIQTDHQLITDGVYGVIRHPIYTSYILLFFGYGLLLQSWWALGLLIVVCAIWFSSRISLEEEMLDEEFGDVYRQYCAETKRLLPFVY